MDSPTPVFYRKLAERVFWTAVQAGLGLLTVEALNIPPVWAAPVAAVLAVIKGFVARRVGDPNDPGMTKAA